MTMTRREAIQQAIAEELMPPVPSLGESRSSFAQRQRQRRDFIVVLAMTKLGVGVERAQRAVKSVNGVIRTRRTEELLSLAMLCLD